MQTYIPPAFLDLVEPMRAANDDILRALAQAGVRFEDYPSQLPEPLREGRAAARAYPMQGILKYHGMTDWDWRIAYLPSVSVCNDAGETVTEVAFDGGLERDHITINGQHAHGRDAERVTNSLNVVRQMAGVSTAARVVSRNSVRASKFGKGLGTSASASAALALAAIAALWGEEAAANRRFVTTVARLLAGSGCRSASGGVSLWLSYPGIAQQDSFAVRLDADDQLRDMRLVTVPLDSRIGLKTETAHRDAPESSLFRSWMQSRRDEVLACITAATSGDWQTLGRWAELDSIRLHGVTMSGSMDNKIFGWEPENITLFRLCNDLRDAGVPVYASTDTGPTVVFLVHQRGEPALVDAIDGLNAGFEVVRGAIGGPATLIDPDTIRWTNDD